MQIMINDPMIMQYTTLIHDKQVYDFHDRCEGEQVSDDMTDLLFALQTHD